MAEEKTIRVCDGILRVRPDMVSVMISKAEALERLAFYEEALQVLHAAEACDPGNKRVRDMVSRIATLDEQSEAGKFPSFVEMVSSGLMPLMASYLAQTEVRMTENKGRGLFASEDMEAGAVVLSEMPLAFAESADSNVLGLLAKQLEERSRLSRRVTRILKALHESDEIPDLGLFKPNTGVVDVSEPGDDLGLVNSDKLVEILMKFTTWGTVHAVEGHLVTKSFSGLWPTLSLVNHSCRYNASLKLFGTRAMLLATETIQAGEEITFSYVDPCMPFIMRTDVLGFPCSCDWCIVEAEPPNHLRDLELTYKRASQEFMASWSGRTRKRLGNLAVDVEQLLAEDNRGVFDKRRIRTIFWLAYKIRLIEERSFLSLDDALEAHFLCSKGQLSVLAHLVKLFGDSFSDKRLLEALRLCLPVDPSESPLMIAAARKAFSG